jgi:hypothetical protein
MTAHEKTNHEIANRVYRIQKVFMLIKEVSASPTIDQQVIVGLHEVSKLIDELDILNDMIIVNERQIDPMM